MFLTTSFVACLFFAPANKYTYPNISRNTKIPIPINLALFHQFFHCTCRLFDWYRWINTMNVIQIQMICFQPLQRSVDRCTDCLWSSVVPYISAVSKNVHPHSIASAINASASYRVETGKYAWLIPIQQKPID